MLSGTRDLALTQVEIYKAPTKSHAMLALRVILCLMRVKTLTALVSNAGWSPSLVFVRQSSRFLHAPTLDCALTATTPLNLAFFSLGCAPCRLFLSIQPVALLPLTRLASLPFPRTRTTVPSVPSVHICMYCKSGCFKEVDLDWPPVPARTADRAEAAQGVERMA